MCQNKNQENLFNDLAKQFSGILAEALLDRLKPEIYKNLNYKQTVPQPTPQINKPASSDKNKTLRTIKDLSADSGLSPATCVIGYLNGKFRWFGWADQLEFESRIIENLYKIH